MTDWLLFTCQHSSHTPNHFKNSNLIQPYVEIPTIANTTVSKFHPYYQYSNYIITIGKNSNHIVSQPCGDSPNVILPYVEILYIIRCQPYINIPKMLQPYAIIPISSLPTFIGERNYLQTHKKTVST